MMHLDVDGERAQRAAHHASSTVRMPAGAAAVDQTYHPPDLVYQPVIGPTMRELLEMIGQSRQSVEARTTLQGALISQVAGDLGGAGQAALAHAECVDDAGAG